MKLTRGLAIAMLVVLIFIPACNLPFFKTPEASNPLAPTTQVPVADAPTLQAPPVQASEQPTADSGDAPLPTFVDDFSDPDSGWGNGSDENGIYAYENGRYHLTATKADWITWQYAGTNIADAIIEVETLFNNNVHQSVGVFCRMMDENNYYVMEITSRGEFAIRAYLNGQWNDLVPLQMQTGNVIQTGKGGANKIQAGCVGKQLVLVVNGQQLAQATTNYELPNGDLGLATGTYDEPGADTYYDNFAIYSMQTGGASVPDSPQPQPQTKPTISSGGSDSNVLYSDDFSQVSGLWNIWKDDTSEARYDQGRFYIKVAVTNLMYYSLLDKNFTDTGVEVDTTMASSGEISVGVICRYQDSDNYYLFYIRHDREFGIWKYKDGKGSAILEPAKSDLIKVGKGAVNKLQAGCVGDRLFFYVNDQSLGEARDSDFTSGKLGIFNGTYSQPNAEALFDNFRVLAPK